MAFVDEVNNLFTDFFPVPFFLLSSDFLDNFDACCNTKLSLSMIVKL